MKEPPSNKIRWWTPLAIIPASALMGLLFGAFTNSINGLVSPTYFSTVLGWVGPNTAFWYLAAIQGMLEGSIIGTGFGLIFSITISASTSLRCPLPFAIKYLAKAFIYVLACWIAGGLIGMLLSHLVPTLWGSVFISIPVDTNPTRFAWVGGTIDGAYVGALIAVILCSIGFHLRWRMIVRSAPPVQGFPILSPRPIDPQS